MTDVNRLLVVTHPVLWPTATDEIVATIPALESQPWDLVEIAPLRLDHAMLDQVDWRAAAAEQERMFEANLRGALAARSRLAYFGLAPIPLSMHLGYRVGAGVSSDVYQRHHERRREDLFDWRWSEKPRKKLPPLRPVVLPERGSTDAGPLVVRVSTAHRVDPEETREVVPVSLSQVDIALVEPGLDALETREAVFQVAHEFRRALEKLKDLYPRRTEIHVFAAVPVGLAFLLGTQINPTAYPAVVTYQYWAKGTPRYQKAIVLTGRAAPANTTIPFRPTAEAHRPVDLSGSVLGDPKLSWANSTCQGLLTLLCDISSREQEIRMHLQMSDMDVADMSFNGPPSLIWKEALDLAARSNRMRPLLEHLLQDRSIAAFHFKLRTIVNESRKQVSST